MDPKDFYPSYGEMPKRYRDALEEYFSKSPGPAVWKLQNFAKYIPRGVLASFLSKDRIFQNILNVHGSIIECGVFAGGSLMTWAQLSSIYEPTNISRKIIGFDTFAGFPELDDRDTKTSSETKRMHVGGLRLPNLHEDINGSVDAQDKNGLVSFADKIILVEGDVVETVPQYLKDNPETIPSLLYLDVDLYKPTKVAIQSFVPRMPKGGVIVFDELNYKTYPGESIAVLETSEINNLRIRRFVHDPQISYAVIGD